MNGMAKELGLKKNFLDVTELIRSIQRAENNPDCFRRARGHCDQLGCAWRPYCIEKPQHLAYERGETHENE
ncbi:MAG: SAP domain-containing protein [Deltaproteobacteria bacterium]|nr:SAP domain-containing protein [Deltaproteobacteria bacterium]MBW2019878.1 SAP domain-containing protein [Deltaproteobacteria bacterium]MBW2074987.1 SAP domain-containing protein [Deltaproteobacteria bacterium]RLB82453.1 MAG: SAP domain-containing protein [Deltaproteobacteria bacterium]